MARIAGRLAPPLASPRRTGWSALALAVVAIIAAGLAGRPAIVRADTSKLGKEDVPLQPKAVMRGKNKLCCGYPLVGDQQWALRFYWLQREPDYDDPPSPHVRRTGACAQPANRYVEIYTRDGYFFGRVPERYACLLRLEGSGLLRDDRVVNYTGACKFGYGTCFEQLDVGDFPFGRGAGVRPLVPFKSVAVDPRIVPIGEPLYIPEFDGLALPDGSIHDGCVRADDTGGGIKGKKLDFFVVTYGNFRALLDALLGVQWITPEIEAPRCDYLRDR